MMLRSKIFAMGTVGLRELLRAGKPEQRSQWALSGPMRRLVDAELTKPLAELYEVPKIPKL